MAVSRMTRIGWKRIFQGALGLCLLFLAALVLSGCARQGAVLEGVSGSPNLRWPPVGEGPKVVWVKTIVGYEDAGIAKGFWRRALEFFAGADDRRIQRPYGVLFGAGNRLYVADPGAGVVHVMDAGKGKYLVLGKKEGGLRTPIGLAEDGRGLVYITDSSSGIVFRYNPENERLERFIVQGVRRPTGIAYSRFNKLLYVVDTLGNRVVAFDTEGRERIRFGSAGDEGTQFNHPTDIAVDGLGKVYVTDALNYKISVYTAEGAPVTQFGTAGDAAGNLNKPKGIALDSDRHIYICESMLDAVQVFDLTGQLLLSFGGNGVGNGSFWMPSGLYIDGKDYIFVADTYNQRIQVFKYVPETKGATPSE